MQGINIPITAVLYNQKQLEIIMRKLTRRPKIGDMSFSLLEKEVDSEFTEYFKTFMKKNADFSFEEDYFIDKTGSDWIVASYDSFSSMFKLTKEFKNGGWGLKIPFAYDRWHNRCRWLGFGATRCRVLSLLFVDNW